jgi:Tol biopolymer transport system component/ankyrin repeat protein
MEREMPSRGRLERLLALGKVQLLLLAVTGVALTWFLYARERAAQNLLRRNRILCVSLGSRTEKGDKLRWDLFVMSSDGSGRTPLTRDDLLEIDPVWSPDGTRIAFAAVAEPKDLSSDIYVMNADGTQRRRLTRLGTEMVAACPTWSPDGRRIAFFTVPWEVGAPDGIDPQLYVIDADGKNLRRLGRGIAPSWSPDGKWILYTDIKSTGSSSTFSLWQMDADDRRRERLIDGAGMGVWSPDGKRIAYVHDQEEMSGIFVMDADGSSGRLLMKIEQQCQEDGLRWMADGRHIVFTRYRMSPFLVPDAAEIWVVDVTSKRETNLTPEGALEGTGGGAFGIYLVQVLSPAGIRNTPLDEALLDALQAGHTTRAMVLLRKGADASARSRFVGIPAWFWAFYNGGKDYDPAMVRALVEYGADVNAKTLEGYTVLMGAAAAGDLGLVRLLLAHGANVSGGHEPAIVAAARSDRPAVAKLLAVVRLLLARGADVNDRGPDGETALMAACNRARPRMVKLLLDHGADVNLQSDDGRTALMRAAWSGDPEVVRLLLERGADPDLKDRKGRTALRLAVEENHSGIVRLLKRASAKRHQSPASTVSD